MDTSRGSSSGGPIAAKVRRVVATDPRVVAVYLFGSTVRNTSTESSDVDLGMLFGEATQLRDVVVLESMLEECLGKSVDVVDVGRCNPLLAVEVIDGERIYCSNSDACDRFELYVLRRAGDLASFEKERREILLRPFGSAT